MKIRTLKPLWIDRRFKWFFMFFLVTTGFKRITSREKQISLKTQSIIIYDECELQIDFESEMEKEYEGKGFDVNTLSAFQIMEYVKWKNDSACQVQQVYGGVLQNSVTPPLIDRQSQICHDQEITPTPGDCLVYSFGIGTNWIFEELMEQYGCHVFAFDPGMSWLGPHKHSKKIWFHRIGLSGHDIKQQNGKLNVSWQWKTLSTIYEMCKPLHEERAIDYLRFVGPGDALKIIPDLIQSGMIKKIRQLEILVRYDPNHTLEQHLESTQIIKLLEDNSLVRFNSNPDEESQSFIVAMETEDFTSHKLTWYNNHYYNLTLV